MRAVHVIDRDLLARVLGGNDQTLSAAVLNSNDEFIRERLTGCVACGVDPAKVLEAIVAGDVSGVDVGAILQIFDIVVHQLGTSASFLDDSWGTDRVLTALDKANVNVDRGLGVPLPWGISRSPTGVPMVGAWSTADLQTMAAEVEAARLKASAEFAGPFATIGRLLAEHIATGKLLIVVDWL